jgi:hypothetical protein
MLVYIVRLCQEEKESEAIAEIAGIADIADIGRKRSAASTQHSVPAIDVRAMRGLAPANGRRCKWEVAELNGRLSDDGDVGDDARSRRSFSGAVNSFDNRYYNLR